MIIEDGMLTKEEAKVADVIYRMRKLYDGLPTAMIFTSIAIGIAAVLL